MKAIGVFTARVVVVMLLTFCAVGAQEAGPKKTPQLTTDDIGASGRASAAPQTAMAASDTLALLPPSDVIAVVDVGRVFDSLLPRLREMAPSEIAKMTAALDEITRKTGVDLLQIKTAVIGIKIPEGSAKQGSGAVIVEGLELDPQKLAALMKAERAEFRTVSYQGKSFFVLSKPKGKTTSSAGSNLGINELALAPLDEQRTVIGDLASVRSVLEAQSGAGRGGANAVLAEALKDANPSGWIRFAANISDSFQQELRKQGGPFQAFAAVRTISGSLAFDMEASSAALDFRMRTSSAGEASQVETSLRGLVAMGKAFLSGDQDPKLRAVSQMLDGIQIGVQGSDVSLSISLQKELMDLLNEPKKKAPAISTR
jgi:hypothetical protein